MEVLLMNEVTSPTAYEKLEECSTGFQTPKLTNMFSLMYDCHYFVQFSVSEPLQNRK